MKKYMILALLITGCGIQPEMLNRNNDCKFTETTNGTLARCDNGNFLLANFEGEGDDTKEIVDVIDFCGTQPGYNEVALRLDDGTLIVYYSMSGGYLGILKPGSYTTTDGHSCSFTVTNDLQVCDTLGCR